jgi:type III secretion protein V
MSKPAMRTALSDLNRYGDVVLATGVIAILGLLVLRLPTPLMDVLVAANIGFGVALLLIAIYVPHPVAFNSFPSVLLISTLFRLALSVATTRLILLDAHAGEIITAFGQLVAGGNLIVGVVVFIIITVVQFIVIAKGAERVAEVAARFTLDAMPGKQLSIDSDLRSGLIDRDEARRRRSLLEQESQMNGALDGAMKFVKGDAIASIIIVIVNLLGGLTIGVLQRGMAVGDAMQLYSILTIGDGMVAQIPALLSAMAAGLVVTRSAADAQDSNLGETIGRQVTAYPRALRITGVVSLLLAIVPGFPLLVFGGLGGLLLFVAKYVSPQQSAAQQPAFANSSNTAKHGGTGTPATMDPAASAQPLVIEYAESGSQAVDADALRRSVAESISAAGAAFGVRFPDPALVCVTQTAAPAWRIAIFDVAVASAEAGAAFSVKALQDGLQDALQRHAGRFVGVQETNDLLEAAAAQYPALVKEVLRQIPTQKVAEVFRSLLHEGIPLRNLRDVLEALAEWGSREKEAGGLTEFARIGLKRYMTSRWADADNQVHAFVVAAAAEDLMRQGLVETPAGVLLRLSPRHIAQLRASVQEQLAHLAHLAASAERYRAAVITSADLRRHLRQLIEPLSPELAVISYQELLPSVQIHPLGTVRFGEETAS